MPDATPAERPRLRILSLEIENFKRIKAARIRPDPTLCVISGRNAQGKSSVLDAIWAALGGKKACPDVPVRKGKGRAIVTLDLGGLVVSRVWNYGGESGYLQVTNSRGERVSSPQAVLDSLIGRIAFDPLAFVQQKPAEQAQVLRTLMGLDLSDLDRQRKTVYDERTDVNRSVKQLEGQLAGIPEVDAPEAELSIADLMAEEETARKAREENDQTRQRLADDIAGYLEAAERVEQLRAELAEAIEDLDRQSDALEESTTLISQLDPEPDLNAIRSRLSEVDQVNARVRARRERAAIVEDLQANREHSAKLTGEIESLDAEASARLAEASARLPIPGLSLEGDTVTLDGIPLEQASSAQQLRTGLAIGGALHPRLAVARIRDGSLLDADSMQLVHEWAESNDMQVFVERVANGEPVGIVIEDGEVVADHQPYHPADVPSLGTEELL